MAAAMKAAFLAVVALVALLPASAQVQLPSGIAPVPVVQSAANNSNAFYLGLTQSDPCTVGPSVFCQSELNMNICNINPNTTIYASGYSSGKTPATTFGAFCANKTLSLAFNGGISGGPAGYTGLYVLALYWAPTACSPTSSAGGGFCSNYTMRGNPAATNLALHGLWPDFGSIYASEPQAPKYTGVYQGWSQYCYGSGFDYSKCHVTGGLCTWANATAANFTQTDYEVCMRATGVKQCQVPAATPAALRSDFARYAPGYLGDDQTFLDHEYFKHGSCLGNYLSRNITAFFETALVYAKQLTAPGSFGYDTVRARRGSSVPYATFVQGLKSTAAPQCNKACQLTEIWYCLGRDAAGFPTQVVNCPVGNLAADTCTTCANIIIPDYDIALAPAPSTGSSATAGRKMF